MKAKVLLDIDGVIGDFAKAFIIHINTHLGAKLDPNQEPPVYNLHRWGHNLSRELINKEVFLWIESGGYANVPIYSGAKQFVYKLMDKYDVHIVTARIGDFNMMPEALRTTTKQDTIDWFKKHGIPDDKLFFEHKKIEFCKQKGISYIIEDKLSTIVNSAHAGFNSILVDRKWNQKGDELANEGHLNRDHPNIHVAYNYEDILNILEQLVR